MSEPWRSPREREHREQNNWGGESWWRCIPQADAYIYARSTSEGLDVDAFVASLPGIRRINNVEFDEPMVSHEQVRRWLHAALRSEDEG